MLLSIAICPLVIPHQWEKWRWAFVLFWSVLFLVPFAMGFGVPTMVDQLLESIIGDYLTFIVLLFGLFCVAGNICLEGDLAGTPKTNIVLLLIGTILASWIGTTGASMVMIRPHSAGQSVAFPLRPHGGVLYFPGIQYWWQPDADRRSSAADGLHAWCALPVDADSHVACDGPERGVVADPLFRAG